MLFKSLGEDYNITVLKGIVKDSLKKSKYLKLFENDYFFNKFFTYYEMKIYDNNEILIHSGENKKLLYV